MNRKIAFAVGLATATLLAACADPAPVVDPGAANTVTVPSAAPAPMGQPANGQPGALAEGTSNAEMPAGHPPTTGMPEGHPPVGGSAAATLAPPAAGSGTGAAALDWTEPAGWTSVPPANAMRKAQYQVPGTAGDGECVVFYFGPGQGGDPRANAERWATQFLKEDGTPATDRLQTEELQVNGRDVLLVRVDGTYALDPMAGGTGQMMADYRLLGAIAEGPDASWFFKCTGPKATMESQEPAFRKWIESLKAGG